MRKVLLSVMGFAFYALSALPAYAQTRPFDAGRGEVAGPTGDVATLKGLETIFFNVVAVILAVAGIALFIMLIIGGFKFMGSGGDRDKPQQARQTLTYAFVGFILIVAAFLILRLISEFTGVDVTIFKVTQ